MFLSRLYLSILADELVGTLTVDGEDFGRTEIVVVLFNGWHFWAHVVVADGVDLPSQCNLAQILGELHFTHYVNSFFFF